MKNHRVRWFFFGLKLKHLPKNCKCAQRNDDFYRKNNFFLLIMYFKNLSLHSEKSLVFHKPK
jgi:hypothetical protein